MHDTSEFFEISPWALEVFERRLHDKNSNHSTKGFSEFANLLREAIATTGRVRTFLEKHCEDELVGGGDLIRTFAAISENKSNVVHTAVVEAIYDNWPNGFLLAPNTTYRVSPSTISRWTTGRRGGPISSWECYYTLSGTSASMDYSVDARRTPIGMGERDENGNRYNQRYDFVGVGLVYVLLWHHQPDGSARGEIRPLTSGGGRQFVTNANGGSMFFYIPDVVGYYSDNDGNCVVTVETN